MSFGESWQKIDQFFLDYPEVKVSKNGTFVRPGDLFRNLLYIKAGICRIYYLTADGKEITLSYLNADKRKMFVGFDERFTVNYYMSAITATIYSKVPLNEYVKFSRKNSDVAVVMINNLLTAIYDLLDQALWLKFGDSKVIVASALIHISNVFSVKTDATATISFKLTHEMISQFTGLSRETVTKVIHNFESQSAVKHINSTLFINKLSLADIIKDKL